MNRLNLLGALIVACAVGVLLRDLIPHQASAVPLYTQNVIKEHILAQGLISGRGSNCSSDTASCSVASLTSTGAVSGTTWVGTGSATATKFIASQTSGAASLDLSANTGGSGSVIQMANGAGINFSVADANAFLSRTAANTIRMGAGTAGTFLAFQFATGTGGNLAIGGNIALSSVAPTVASGFGTSPTIVAGTSTSFRLNVGTGGTASSGVVTLPTGTTGWNCEAHDMTNAASFVTVQTASSTTSATFTNYSRTTGLLIAWTASDVLNINCVGL